ncbi:MAG: translation initiation factor IF-3 [Caldisericia bacterium]
MEDKIDNRRFDDRRNNKKRNALRINKEIRVPNVRLIDEVGNQVGVVSVYDAIERATLAGLDLVEISPNSDPPVCKILDYGKYRYELEKKAKENRRKQVHADIKEMQFRLSVDVGDFKTKLGHVRRFLLNGNKAKVGIRFRGREMIHKQRGFDMLQEIADEVESLGFVEHQPRLDGRRMHMIIAPHKKKETTENG